MRIKFYIFFVMSIIVQTMPVHAREADNSDLSREYKIKAAFLHNFIQFVDWPEGKAAGQNDPIILGIIGEDPFGDSFEPIKNKQIKGRKSFINRFEGIEKLKKSNDRGISKIDSLRKCHLLFICSSEKDHLKEIITLVSGYGVLTVSETSNMLKSGGVINFLVEENKVHFEINLSAAKQEKLKIRSQLLRLATRVIDDDSEEK